MWETTFTYSSSTALPAHISLDLAIATLHDFETVVRLSPDCRGCRRIAAPPDVNGSTAKPPPVNGNGHPTPLAAVTLATPPQEPDPVTYYEVEDDLPFIPKKLWSGGVKYRAEFVPTANGCDITVHAPGGFTSMNHWRVMREGPHDAADAISGMAFSKDTEHAETESTGGWQVQIVSDAKCPWTFASFVKGFLKNSHIQLQLAFIEKVQANKAPPRSRRPMLGRRRSSMF